MKKKMTLEEYIKSNIVAEKWQEDFIDVLNALDEMLCSYTYDKINKFWLLYDNLKNFTSNIIDEEIHNDSFLYYINDAINAFEVYFDENLPISMDPDNGAVYEEWPFYMEKSLEELMNERLKRDLS